MQRTAWDIPRTMVDYPRGQVQSYPIDYTLSVMQSMAMPTVYSAQKRLLQAQQGVAERQTGERQASVSGVTQNHQTEVVLPKEVNPAAIVRQGAYFISAERAKLAG